MTHHSNKPELVKASDLVEASEKLLSNVVIALKICIPEEIHNGWEEMRFLHIAIFV